MKRQLKNEGLIKNSIKKNKMSKFKMINYIGVAFLIMLFFGNYTYAESGEKLFKTNCSSCHSTGSKKTVGPGLGGVNERRSDEWLIKWVKNSQELIASGDEQAIAIFKEYDEMTMQNFEQFSDDEITSIFTYIAQQPAENTAANSKEENTTLSLNFKIWMWGALFLLILGIIMYRFKTRMSQSLKGMGFSKHPHSIDRLGSLFLIFIIIATVIIYALTKGLETNVGHLTEFFFGVFPYIAISIFNIGSVYFYVVLFSMLKNCEFMNC